MANLTTAQLEELGRKISVQCEWDGLKILLVAIEALTDANFHSEAEVLEQMYKAISQSETELEYQLTIGEES